MKKTNKASDSPIKSVRLWEERDPDYNKCRRLIGSIITTEGVIGVGKTTLGRSLVSYFKRLKLKSKFFPEYHNEVLLAQFIGDMKKYAYGFQLCMLMNRIRIYREAEDYSKRGGIAVVDRSLEGDMTFARMHYESGNISEVEWQVYLSVVKGEAQLEPAATIFLECSATKSLQRVNRRGNQEEIDGYDLDYMKKLCKAYEETFKRKRCSPVLRVTWEEDIILVNDQVPDEILGKIIALIP
jgi:deoxyadenosine/deoxycytidine kinase